MKIKVSEDVISRNLAGEVVLLELTQGIYFGLDDVGSRIWSLLSENASQESVVVTLLSEYDVSEATLRLDVDGLIRKLADKGLVEISP